MPVRPALRFALATLLFLASAAHAQLFRAYLTPDGNDANPCTLPSPCRLLPAALAAVASGGEIWLLDSANYNTATVNITKSVTILAVPGALGSVVATGGPAISIATAGVRVTLRNLVIVPLPGGLGTDGVNMTNGDALTVDKCSFANLPAVGISVTTAANVRIADTSIRDSTSAGVTLTNGARGVVTRLVAGGNVIGINVNGTVVAPTTVDVSDSTFERNNTGIYLLAPGSGNVARATVRSSSIIGGNYGLAAEADPGAVAWLTASYNTLSNNVAAGIYNNGGRVRVSGNAITGNATGLWNLSGPFETAGNNMVGNNTLSDTSGTITLVGTQ